MKVYRKKPLREIIITAVVRAILLYFVSTEHRDGLLRVHARAINTKVAIERLAVVRYTPLDDSSDNEFDSVEDVRRFRFIGRQAKADTSHEMK